MVGDLEGIAQLGQHLGAHQLVHLVVFNEQDHAFYLLVVGLVGTRLPGRGLGCPAVQPGDQAVEQFGRSDRLGQAAGEAPEMSLGGT